MSCDAVRAIVEIEFLAYMSDTILDEYEQAGARGE
jgi:hypothetical protein